MAGSKFLAKLASTRGKPDGLLVVPPGRALDFLHPLPVDALWGAGQATIDVLARYGLRTVGDVAATPRATLERALGPAAGAQLHQLAWARDDREVVPFEAAKSVGSEETFAADIDDPERLAREVLRCCVRTGRRLREAGLAGRTVTLKLRFADFRTITRGRTLAVATDTDTELHQVAGELLAQAPARPGPGPAGRRHRQQPPAGGRAGAAAARPGTARLGGGGAGRRRGQGPLRRRRHRPGLPHRRPSRRGSRKPQAPVSAARVLPANPNLVTRGFEARVPKVPC